MKNVMLILLCLVSLFVSAQTQMGIVKTRGRLDNKGNAIPGKRISGATIQVKGKNAVVTDANGSFSFPVPSKSFMVQSVKKQGYVLVDLDALAIQYNYSSNPLIFVMEVPSRITADKNANVRKLRSPRPVISSNKETRNKKTVTKQKDKLKKHNEENQYHSMTDIDMTSTRSSSHERLYIKKQSYDQLISEMAHRYTLIDYDQLDELERRICYCILNRKFAEAESLLRSKGNIKDRINATYSVETVQTTDSTELALNQINSDSIKDRELRAKISIARDCYYLYDRFILEQKYDSAAYYLDLRASIDTLNLEWLNEAGSFIADRLKDDIRALAHFKNGLRLVITQHEEQSEWGATFHENIGIVLYNLSAIIYKDNLNDKYEDFLNKSIIHLLQALVIRENLLGSDDPLTQEAKEKLEFVNQQSNQWKKKQNK